MEWAWLHLVSVGCRFVGGRDAIAQHKGSCTFKKDESQLIAMTMSEVRCHQSN